MKNKTMKIKTLLLIFLSFFIIQCEEVDEVLYGDETNGSQPATPPVNGSEFPFEPTDIAGMEMWLDGSDPSTLFTNSREN